MTTDYCNFRIIRPSNHIHHATCKDRRFPTVPPLSLWLSGSTNSLTKLLFRGQLPDYLVSLTQPSTYTLTTFLCPQKGALSVAPVCPRLRPRPLDTFLNGCCGNTVAPRGTLFRTLVGPIRYPIWPPGGHLEKMTSSGCTS